MIVFIVVLIGLILFYGICAYRAKQIVQVFPYRVHLKETPERTEQYSQKLSEMIQHETISSVDNQDLAKFYQFHRLLEGMFPALHATCEKHDFDGSLLFKWSGQDSSKAPILLMNHFDVVEASGAWQDEPFAGVIRDGQVFGRGAVDDKGPLFVMLQAIEELINEGVVPSCDVYIASSNTEEIGGDGAPKTAAYLKSLGLRFRMLLDEGGMIVDQPLPILKGTYAMVGVVEKGYGDLKFIATSQGGHASAPGKKTPLVRLGQFMNEIEDNYPLKSKLTPTLKEMIRRLSVELPFKYRLITANLWLFGPVLKWIAPMSGQIAAMMRTSVAFTTAKGSEGYNVLPQEAYVTANVRYMPHQANEASHEILRKVASKFDLKMEVLKSEPPAPVVNYQGEPFKLIEQVIGEIYPGMVVSPYIMTGGTDAKYYNDLTDDGIRFAPLYIHADQMNRVHGIDENIDAASLAPGVDFYKILINKL